MFFFDKSKYLNGPRRVTESLFILLVIFSVFLFIAIASHDAQDPSWSQTGTSQETNNMVGIVGSTISDLFLNFVGYGSYIVPIVLLYLGFCILIKRFTLLELDWFTIGLRIIGFTFIFCSILVLISMNVLDTPDYGSGGIVGTILASLSISYFNEIGTSLLYLCLFMCGIPLFTGVSWLSICDVIGQGVLNLIFFREYWTKKREREEQYKLNEQKRKEAQEKAAKEKPFVDPHTGFAIFLRDENELKFEGPAYGDDDSTETVADSNITETDQQTTVEENPQADNQKNDTSRIVNLTEKKAQEVADKKISTATSDTASVIDSIINEVPSKNEELSVNTVRNDNQQSETHYDNDRLPSVESRKVIEGSALTQDSAQTQKVPVTSEPNEKATNKVVATPAPTKPTPSPDDDIDAYLASIEPASVLDSYNFDNTSSDTDEIDSQNDSSDLKFDNTGYSNSRITGGASNVSESEFPGFENENSFEEESTDFNGSFDDFDSSYVENSSSVETDEQLKKAPWAQKSETSGEEQKDNIQECKTAPNSPFWSIKSRPSTQELGDKYNPEFLPGINLLKNVPPKPNHVPKEQLEQLGILIEQKLKEFRIDAAVVGYEPGPVITRFSLQLSPGTKVSKINDISRDLARELAAKSVRVVDIIPGTTYVGLELPNAERTTVYFKELIDSDEFANSNAKLTCALGCDIVGKPVVMNLAKMPHLLVAGTTGSGKSVGVNGMILSLLYKATPDDLRLIMIDPKMLEFSSYNDIPHLLTEVVTEIKYAPNALRWCVGEMERRYKLMSKLNVKKIDEYNEKVAAAIKMGEPILDPLWKSTDQLSDEHPCLKKLPYIVVVIDELADMMMQVGKKVEELIARLAQKARAAGIHMIIATQSPRSDVLTGLIKSNIPSRVGFTVSNGMESRIILEQQGAESLLGNGDMLYSPVGSSNPVRVHGAYVSPEEIDRVVEFWKQQGSPEYVDTILDDEITEENALPSEKAEIEANRNANGNDPMLGDAIKLILANNQASTSMLQRRMGIGFPRAGKIVDQLEELGLISRPINNAGKRNIFKDKCEAFLMSGGEDTGPINNFGFYD